MNDYYDLEALKRFTEKVDKNCCGSYDRFIECKRSGRDTEPENLGEGITKEEFLAVARALSAVIVAGVDLRKELGIRKKTGPKKGRLGQTIHDPEFGIVVNLEAGEITYSEAVDILMKEFHIEKTASEKFIKDRREAARNVVKIFSVISAKT